MRTRRLLALLGLVFPLALAEADGIDLHAYWDSRCAACHGDAGDFARRTLTVVDGRLQGRHHRDDLERFLRQHHTADALVPPVLAMLRAQRETPPLYREHCLRCHGRASDFVRGELAWQDGQLVSRAGMRPVAPLLQRHGALAADERVPLLRSLERIAGEIGLR